MSTDLLISFSREAFFFACQFRYPGRKNYVEAGYWQYDGNNGDGHVGSGGGNDGYSSGSDTETDPVYDAKGDPELRATRRPAFDDMRDNGVDVDGQNYTLHPHTYNSLFKSGRKDIMPDDIIDALKTEPSPAKPGSVKYINPETDTKVYVNPDSKAIVGVWPAKFK